MKIPTTTHLLRGDSGSSLRERALLACAGAAVILTQYVAVREIGSSFFSTELVVLGAVAVTLVGPSIAYAVADELSTVTLAAWGALSLVAHLCLPFGLRALVGALSARGLDTWGLLLTAGLGCLLLTGFYSVFLPRCARGRPSLSALYSTELVGAVAALALIALSPSWRWTLGAFWALAAVVVWLGLGRALWAAGLGGLAALLVFFYPALDAWASVHYLRGYHGHRAPRPIETTYSPYQRVDVVEDVDGRYLYLDGVPFYRPGDLDAFNVVLAQVPGAARPTRGAALVIGSGSFSSAARLHRLGYSVTVVELDAAVATLGERHFAQVHRLAPGDVKVVIDDGRRFLSAAPPASFDLIVLDVPAPYHLQTALLHTPRFYRQVASRLRPGGVAAVSLCDELEGEVGRAIAASAASAFGELLVVESEGVGTSVLYGGASLPFERSTVSELLSGAALGEVRLSSDAEVRGRLTGALPLTEQQLGPVLVLSRGAWWGEP